MMASPGDEAPAEEKPAPSPGDAASSALIGEAARLVIALLRDEAALAGAEMRQSVRQLAGAAALIVIAAGVFLGGLLAFLAAAIAALALFLPVWLAAFSIGVGALLIGAVLAWLAQRRLDRIRIIPARTRRSFVDTIDWMRGRGLNEQG